MSTHSMRAAGVVLCLALGFSVAGFSQTPSHPRKALTPEQREFQQQMRVVEAKRQNLRVATKQPFDAEVAREKAGVSRCSDEGCVPSVRRRYRRTQL